MAPRPLAKSPVSFSLGDEVPHIFIRESHQRPRKILISGGKTTFATKSALGVFHCGAQNFDAIGGTADIDWPPAPIASEAYDPGCVKTPRGINTPIILRSVVTRSASKCENSPSARHYDQIRLSFCTAKTQTGSKWSKISPAQQQSPLLKVCYPVGWKHRAH
jgi:hypothetical protein